MLEFLPDIGVINTRKLKVRFTMHHGRVISIISRNISWDSARDALNFSLFLDLDYNSLIQTTPKIHPPKNAFTLKMKRAKKKKKKKTQLKSFKLDYVEALFSQTHTISPMNLYTNTLMSDITENSFT